MTVLLLGTLQPPDIQAELERRFAPHWEPDGVPDDIKTRITVVVTRGDLGLPGDLMATLPALKLVAVYGVGVDAVDLVQAHRRGIAVTNTPDVLTDAVAELALGLMLATARRIAEGDRYVRAGSWSRTPFGLSGTVIRRTVGILGYGRIGQRIGAMVRALGMPVLYGRSTPVPGEEAGFRADPVALARECDVLVVTASGGARSHHIVDQAVLQALGPTGLLVNVARGSVVDEAALTAAIEAGTIAGAGLDVFADEPLVPNALRTSDRVVLTPHIGSATTETRTAMGRLVIDNVAAFLDGRPLLTPLAPAT